jgi:hypothetical protein
MLSNVFFASSCSPSEYFIFLGFPTLSLNLFVFAHMHVTVPSEILILDLIIFIQNKYTVEPLIMDTAGEFKFCPL